VRGAFGRARFVPSLVEQVAADVAAWNADAPRQSDHDVRKILANPLPAFERVIDGRIHARALGNIGDLAIQRGVEVQHQMQWIAPPGLLARFHAELLREPFQQLAGLSKVAGHQHLDVVAGRDHLIQLGPGRFAQRLGQRQHGLHVHQRVGDDRELLVPPRDIEVMDRVAKIVPIGLHTRPGMHHELKRQAALWAVRARLHARLHQAFAHVLAIAEFRQMADAVIH